MKRHPTRRRLLLCSLLLLPVAALVQAYPEPSPYPISWEIKFEHSHPKRVMVTPRNGGPAQAYWYMTYTVANLGNQEITFMPVFQMLFEDGSVIRSDSYRYTRTDEGLQPVMLSVEVNGQQKQVPQSIPTDVLATVRSVERNANLQSVNQIATTLRIGEDQAKEGVAIFPEPSPNMGKFSILVTGLSGESVILKDDKGNPIMREEDGKKSPIILRKTLKIDYQMIGDGRTGANVEFAGQEWVMR